jgi:ssDNA-binding Zn-finger/Zn-ribbon topoisomerase 1
LPFSFLKRLFPSREASTPDEDMARLPRYVDEKRAKAIKQAALFAETNGARGAPQCHRCGAEMTLQLAKRGDRSGSRFWGCSEYPACKATRKA